MSFEQKIQSESERFHTLFDRLSNTHWSETALPEAQSHLETLQNQARFKQDKIDAFNAAADKEHKRLIKVKGPSVRHAWYKVRGKLEQRLDEQERVWLQEFEKCKEEEQRLAVLNEEIHSAQTYVNQYQSAFREYTSTKQSLDELLERFFSGATPSYPEEDAIEQNLKEAQEHLIKLQNYHRIITHVYRLLRRAHEALVASRRALDSAMSMNTFDLFSDSSFADVAVNSHLANARNMSTQAQQLINEARRVYPSIPYVGDLQIKQDNLIFNMMFDNIWTDMNMRHMISEALDRVSRADVTLMSILFEMQQNLEQCETDRNKTNNDVKQLADEHFTARINIVRNIIESPPPYSSS